MAAAIAVLILISLLVLADVPAESDDSTEQMMTYLSLVLFVMALALVGPLAFAIARRGDVASEADNVPDPVVDDIDDEASDIELEFRALEMEIDKGEMG